ncbi:MAG: hypothetical protein IJD10_05445, partial [Clostridia bacterium]|nr:hypothetical protein [Clostridia bacterium]
MKKLALFLLLAIMILSVAVACRDDHGEDNETTSSTETTAVTDGITTDSETTAPETEPNNVSVNGVTVEGLNGWFEYGGALIRRDKYQYVGTRDSMEIAMAKNEMEGFQYILLSGANYDGLRCEISALSDGKGNTLEGTVHVVYNIYVTMSDGFRPLGFTPEILMPQDDDYQGGTFDLVAMRAKTLYVQYKTDANTVPGTYTGRLEIKQGDTVLKTHDVSVKVWDVYYDEETECKTLYQYGYYWGSAPGPGPDSAPTMDMYERDEDYQIRLKYVDFMLENRVSPWNSPMRNELLCEDFELVKKYMDNPRLNTMYIFQHHQEQEKQIEIARENGWLDKLAVFSYEEPAVPEDIDRAKEFAIDIKNRTGLTNFNGAWCPSIATQRVWMFPEEGPNIFERFAEFTTMTTINAITASEPEVYEALQAYRAKGNTVFWYVCGN